MIIAALAAAALAATPADTLLDLRKPTAVAAALQEAGYKAELKKNDRGEPYILSAANGSPFSIEFYSCSDQTGCDSFQFSSWYKPDPLYTAALANEWNSKKRFLKVAVDDKGNLNEWIDVSAIGKQTQANFADWIDWYQSMDSDLVKFLASKRDAAKAATAPTKPAK